MERTGCIKRHDRMLYLVIERDAIRARLIMRSSLSRTLDVSETSVVMAVAFNCCMAYC